FSQPAIGIGRTGAVFARSKKLFADIERVFLVPENPEVGLLQLSEGKYVVHTSNYELTIQASADAANLFDCNPKTNQSPDDYPYLIVEGIGPQPFYVSMEPGIKRQFGLIDWTLSNYIGKDVRISLAKRTQANSQRFTAYVNDATSQLAGFWRPKEPTSLT